MFLNRQKLLKICGCFLVSARAGYWYISTNKCITFGLCTEYSPQELLLRFTLYSSWLHFSFPASIIFSLPMILPGFIGLLPQHFRIWQSISLIRITFFTGLLIR